VTNSLLRVGVYLSDLNAADTVHSWRPCMAGMVVKRKTNKTIGGYKNCRCEGTIFCSHYTLREKNECSNDISWSHGLGD